MNDYQREQLDALTLVRRHLGGMTDGQRRELLQRIESYLSFRKEVDAFLADHFQAICTAACYQDRRSACCSKDGIITFFADHVVNGLRSRDAQLAKMDDTLQQKNPTAKCVYLTPSGCCWTVRPLVCAMFLCDRAQETVFAENPHTEAGWERLRALAKSFRWPDRPVLFDALEQVFLDAGYRSPLMYLNLSPGLLRIKRRAGLPVRPA